MAILSYALCAVTDIEKQFNDGTSYGANDTTVVENMINLVTQYAEKYIGRNIKTRGSDVTETFDIEPNTQEIFVPNFPIISVTSVTEDGTALTEGEDDDYIKYDDTGRFVKNNSFWTKGFKKVVIVYEGGFATIPEQLLQWCVEVVGYMFESATDGNVASERVGQLSISYASVSSESVGNIVAAKPWLKETLDFYKTNFM